MVTFRQASSFSTSDVPVPLERASTVLLRTFKASISKAGLSQAYIGRLLNSSEEYRGQQTTISSLYGKPFNIQTIGRRRERQSFKARLADLFHQSRQIMMRRWGAPPEAKGLTVLDIVRRASQHPKRGSNARLPLDPAASHGMLDNGMQYFIRHAAKPKGRIALALVVNVGSLVEEDSEQGVAHILEHLAFNATEKYSNHDIVRFLESIGAEFGACQNARTSFDETVYELLVPTSDLSKALSVFAEFATKIRCDPEDLKKERGAVLDEWRGTRSVEGRATEVDWKIMCQGCKYAHRLPIGLESIIRNVPAAMVKAFYDRWYWPQHMAVVVVGDIADHQLVLAELKQHMEPCQPHSMEPCPAIPRVSLPPHEDTRFHAWVDREQQQASVQLVYQRAAPVLHSPADLKDLLTEGLFITAFNNRLFRISRRREPPFYSASMSSGVLTRTIQSACLSATVHEGGHEQALEELLMELARVRCHGFSEHEVAAARAEEMAETESLYREREQQYSTDLREEYIRHFLSGELVVGREKEARLTKTLLPLIQASDLLQVAQRFKPTSNCIVKAASHRRAMSTAALKAVVERVERQERGGQVSPWQEVASTASIIPEDQLPEPGSISSSRDFPYVGARELMLSNGMKVCYKCTGILEDQVLVGGTAVGGLSQVTLADFRTCSLATRLAGEISQFGHPPEVLAEIMMGKRVELNLAVGPYSRGFSGEQSPLDLETAFQLLYRLFTHRVSPVDGDLATCLRYLRESVAIEMRNPMKTFLDRARFINHNHNHFYKPLTLEEVDRLDPHKACDYFNACFHNPAQFTVCLTGSIKEEAILSLVTTYLASIPATDTPWVMSASDVTPLPQDFPDGVVIEDVKTTVVAPQGVALITIPITLPFEDGLVAQGKIFTVMFCCQLLETRLLRLLRFKFGEVYSVQAGVGWRTAPSGAELYVGELSITFTCDPSSSLRLVEMAIAEFERLQMEACTEEEVDTLLRLEDEDWQMQQEENSFWQTSLVSAYSSRFYRQTQDVDATIRRRDRAREELREQASPQLLLEGYREYFPHPIRSRYTAVTFSPRKSLLMRLRGWFESDPKAMIFAGSALVATMAVGALCLARWLRKR